MLQYKIVGNNEILQCTHLVKWDIVVTCVLNETHTNLDYQMGHYLC